MATELDALDPTPETLKLVSGNAVVLEDLRARQFFKLLRIVTHGALPLVQDMSLFQLDPDGDAREFGARLAGILALSIPDAEDETIAFVRAMCKPYGLIEGRKLNKADTERNNALWANLDAELDNPELDDLVSIVEAVVRREAADLQALGKRLAGMLNLAKKTGQLAPTSTPTTPPSSADSVARSTFSPANTAGPTTSASTSASGGYANVWQPSASDADSPSGNESSG